jgi:hypothetical protein
MPSACSHNMSYTMCILNISTVILSSFHRETLILCFDANTNDGALLMQGYPSGIFFVLLKVFVSFT